MFYPQTSCCLHGPTRSDPLPVFAIDHAVCSVTVGRGLAGTGVFCQRPSVLRSAQQGRHGLHGHQHLPSCIRSYGCPGTGSDVAHSSRCVGAHLRLSHQTCLWCVQTGRTPSSKRKGPRRTIDVWWERADGGMMLLLAQILTRNRVRMRPCRHFTVWFYKPRCCRCGRTVGFGSLQSPIRSRTVWRLNGD